jgi:hypothetical protein
MTKPNLSACSIWVLLAVLCLPLRPCSAQIDSVTHTLLGVTGGASVYDIWFSPAIPSEPVQTTSFAVALRHVTNRNLGIHVEAQYTRSGWASEGYERRFDVLQIPIQTHVSFGRGSFRPYVLAGEILTVILMGEETGSSSTFDGIAPDHKVHIGIGGGVGILKHFRHGTLQLEVRGDYHLTNLFKSDHPLLPVNVSNPWSGELTIGYLYRIGDGL